MARKVLKVGHRLNILSVLPENPNLIFVRVKPFSSADDEASYFLFLRDVAFVLLMSALPLDGGNLSDYIFRWLSGNVKMLSAFFANI